jgi:hypothetical protein
VADVKNEKREQTKQAHAISENDDDIAANHSVNDPQCNAGAQNEEHVEREVVALTRFPTFLDLRKIRGGGKNRCEEIDECV